MNDRSGWCGKHRRWAPGAWIPRSYSILYNIPGNIYIYTILYYIGLRDGWDLCSELDRGDFMLKQEACSAVLGDSQYYDNRPSLCRTGSRCIFAVGLTTLYVNWCDMPIFSTVFLLLNLHSVNIKDHDGILHVYITLIIFSMSFCLLSKHLTEMVKF